MKSGILLILMAVAPLFNLLGQETLEIPIQELNTTWTNFYENENLSMDVRYTDCSDEFNGIYQDYFLISLKNKTNKTILVDWHYNLYYGGICKSCDDPDNEFLFRYELLPGEILEPDCSNYVINAPYQLAVFRSIINNPELSKLTKAEISNLTFHIY